MMALVAATGGAVALIMEDVMDDVFIERRPGMVAVIAAWVLVIFLVRGASAYGQTVLLGRIGNRIVARLQTRIHDHVLPSTSICAKGSLGVFALASGSRRASVAAISLGSAPSITVARLSAFSTMAMA